MRGSPGCPGRESISGRKEFFADEIQLSLGGTVNKISILEVKLKLTVEDHRSDWQMAINS